MSWCTTPPIKPNTRSADSVGKNNDGAAFFTGMRSEEGNTCAGLLTRLAELIGLQCFLERCTFLP